MANQTIRILLLDFLLLALLFVVGDAGAVDLTVTEKAKGSDVVDAVVDLIVQSCIFDNDRLMLRRIAYAETRDGLDARTFTRNGADFYGGIWQVDESSFTASKSSSNNQFHEAIENVFGIDWKNARYRDLWKPLHCGLAARMKITRHYLAANSGDIPQTVSGQADYWVNFYTINSWLNATKTYTDASKAVSTRCSSPKADVVFVMDSSKSIGYTNFGKVKSFVSKVVSSFDVSQKKVRVAVIQFSNSVKLEFDLEKYNNVSDVKSAVSRMRHMNSGTRSDLALKKMRELIQQQGRHGEGVPVSSIFLTDGRSNQKTATQIEAASVHRQLPEVTVFAVGVGSNVGTSELKAIASKPSGVHVYRLTSFTDVTAFSDQIMGQACKTSAQLPQDSDVTGNVEKGQHYYFKIIVRKTERGVRITIKVKAGVVRMYFSYKIQNPNAAIYDFFAEVDDVKSIFIPWSGDAVSRCDLDDNGRKKRSTDQGQNATLYGAVVGEYDGQNEFTLSYTDSAVRNTGSFLAASLLSLAVAYRIAF